MTTQITFNHKINLNINNNSHNSIINLQGSGINGKYLPYSQNSFYGSAGGILASLSPIILINLSGNITTSQNNVILFTGLLTLTVTENDVTLTITNSFGIDYQTNQKYNLTITDNCSNAILANNIRYLNIGSFTLNINKQ